ncbi:glycoside hydrolase [Azohydromonas lata]|uniref:glycoside hydrolase n=1 Tax=Azohydromonas lata TaxID=45677 RepID=UPI000AB3CB9D|nr:glycoside hydrolase [Azohydromonas lata]
MKYSFQSRVALTGSMISLAVMLAACGGGEDETAAQAESAQAVALESAKAVTSTTTTSDGFMPEVTPDAWELANDPTVEQSFLAAMQQKAASAPLLSAAVTDARVKWNPGHYIALGRRDATTLQQALTEIKDLPQVKGLILRYEWPQIETSKGVYDFTRIDRDLALAQSAGKRLWVMVGTKVFTSGGRAVPDYMHTAEYEGGAYKILIGARDALGSNERYGENAALHNVKVRDRLIALATALGNRYNRNNAFEGMTFNETAMGQMAVPLTTTQRTAYFTNLAAVDAATQRAFPNTVAMQFINFPRPYMAGLITNMVNSKVALGGPDILMQDPDLTNNIYPLYDLAKGKVPVGPSVQPENYLTTVQNGPLNPPKISDLYAFGRNRLGANYMFWTRSFTGSPAPYPKVLEFFKSSAFPKDSSGGLNATCPSTYAACVPKL